MSHDKQRKQHDKECKCGECRRIFDEWCDIEHEEHDEVCERKKHVKIIYEVKCVKTKLTTTEWGYKEAEEHRHGWKLYCDAEGPKDCKEANCHKKH